MNFDILQSSTVILARVSSKAQEEEGFSLDSQLKLLISYAESKDLHVIKVFKIAETASKDQSRKIFHELMDYLNNGEACNLLVEKTDRLTRNFRDSVAIDDWLEVDERRKLHAVKENLLLHKNARSDVKFMWNIHVSVAKKYADNLREESMKGWAEKLAQGWMPAPPPPGYMSAVKDGKRIHIPNPATMSLLKQAFELYIEPQHSFESIAREMNTMGITTHKGRPYHKSQVQHILTNTYYIGINRFDGKDYPGAQETFISEDLFRKVQLKMHAKRPTRYAKHNPIFKNLIRCAHCNGIITWQLQKGRYYGACQRSSKTCRARKLLREDQLEGKIVKMLSRLVCPRSELIEWTAEAMKSRHKDNVNVSTQLTSSIQTQVDRLKRMDNNLYDDKIAGEISLEKYDFKHKEILSQLKELGSRLSSVDRSYEKQLDHKLVLLELTQRAADIYKERGVNERRLIITKLFEDLVYKDEFVSVKYTNFANAIAENVVKTRQLIGG